MRTCSTILMRRMRTRLRLVDRLLVRRRPKRQQAVRAKVSHSAVLILIGGCCWWVQLEDENDAYFSDMSPGGTTSGLPLALPLDQPAEGPVDPPRVRLTRPGPAPHQFADKPEWIMPVVVQGGVWDMIKTVGRWKGEGWASLWKGE